MSQTWNDRAAMADLRSVLDPADARGDKNLFIDLMHKAALARDFRFTDADVVLDLGCGLGRFTSWLRARASYVVGIDISAPMLELASHRHADAAAGWVLYSGHEIPIRSASVDRVLSVFVLQHVLGEDNLASLVGELRRVVRPGGQVAILEQINRRRAVHVTDYIEQRLPSDYHAAFQAAGFDVVSSRAVRVPWTLTYWVSKGRFPRRLLPAIAYLDVRLAPMLDTGHTYSDHLMVFGRRP